MLSLEKHENNETAREININKNKEIATNCTFAYLIEIIISVWCLADQKKCLFNIKSIKIKKEMKKICC